MGYVEPDCPVEPLGLQAPRHIKGKIGENAVGTGSFEGHQAFWNNFFGIKPAPFDGRH